MKSKSNSGMGGFWLKDGRVEGERVSKYEV